MSMQQWAALCMAAGFDVRSMDPMDVFALAGKIIRDYAYQRNSDIENWHESDRVALRERVSGVVQFVKK